MTTTLDAAIDYSRRGLSIIPMKMAEKKPALRWKRYQARPASKTTVQRWFGNGSKYGVAVVFGEVSGGLASRDYDDTDGYDFWAEAHPDLARMLPTVETRRGRHVYCRAAPGSVDAIRRRLNKPGTGAIALGDGELRAGVGCYSVLPPSHHPSGHIYRWLVPLGEDLPVVDLEAAFFSPCNREDRESRGGQRTVLGGGVCVTGGLSALAEKAPTVDSSRFSPSLPSLPSPPSALPAELHDQIELAIVATTPGSAGRRHKLVFKLARHLKAIPELADAPLAELKPIVLQWHTRALPFINTKAFEETWFDFAEGWGKVKFPAGQEPIAALLAIAVQAEVPEVAKQYEQPQLRLLVALCRELQSACGAEPFFLATRTAGGLLGVDPATAWRWLRGLQNDGILKAVTKGSQATGKASRYRYLA